MVNRSRQRFKRTFVGMGRDCGDGKSFDETDSFNTCRLVFVDDLQIIDNGLTRVNE